MKNIMQLSFVFLVVCGGFVAFPFVADANGFPSARTGEGVLGIDTGRQLFVDDYLVSSMTNVVRTWPKPVKVGDSPVLRPETDAERETASGGTRAPCSIAFSGGLWWDPRRKAYRLWYQAGWGTHMAYAESADGITWRRPNLDVVLGTNLLLPGVQLDSWCVWPDYTREDPYSKWWLMVSEPGDVTRTVLYAAEDGFHWQYVRDAGASGDRSTMFFDPFRKNWVFSLRSYYSGKRDRARFDVSDLNDAAWRWPKEFIGFGEWSRRTDWTDDDERPSNRAAPYAKAWLKLDARDVQDSEPGLNRNGSLYCVDAVPYESIMLGAFQIHWGPENWDCLCRGLPKITDISFAYSRNGTDYMRPDRTGAIRASRWGSGRWDTGYVSPVAGICMVSDEKLRFLYNGFRGDPSVTNLNWQAGWAKCGMHFNGAIGLAELRRDGFCGLVAEGRGEIVTKSIRFSGSQLFVNGNWLYGSLEVDVLDEKGGLLATLPAVSGDGTKIRVGDVGAFAGKPVRFRFRNNLGTLYSFWVARDQSGKSFGYVAAGGPEYSGVRDE